MAAYKHNGCPLFLESFTDANRTVLLDGEGYCRSCADLGQSNVLAAFHPREAALADAMSQASFVETIQETHQMVSQQQISMASFLTQLQNMQNKSQAILFFKETSTDRASKSQECFKRNLVMRYANGIQREKDYQGQVMWKTLRCMVTETELFYNDCQAGHIVPHCAAKDLWVFDCIPEDINDPNNGMLWARGIENVFHPPGSVCILYNFFEKNLRFMVLDPSLKSKPIDGTDLKFSDVHGKLIRTNKTLPRLRYLWVHAKTGIDIAGRKGWLDPASEDWKIPLEMMQEAMQKLGEDERTKSQDAADEVVVRVVRAREDRGGAESISGVGESVRGGGGGASGGGLRSIPFNSTQRKIADERAEQLIQVAAAAPSGQRLRKYKHKIKKRNCFKCGAEGHFRAACPLNDTRASLFDDNN